MNVTLPARTPSQLFLVALNNTHSNIYAGTVPPAEVAHRCARNKAARRSRRINRRRA